MKDKCGCNNQGSAQEIAQLKNMVQDLADIVNSVKAKTDFIFEGHPILLIEEQTDVDCFSFVTGEGSDRWTGWAILGGYTIFNPVTKKNVTVPNWSDRFVVMAGGAYANKSIGGLATVSLTAAQNGPHGHVVTDAGHSHGVTDPQHTHIATAAEITPGATAEPHDHTISDPGHAHTTLGSDSASTPDGAVGYSSQTNAGSSQAGNNTGSAATGIGVNDASISITVTPFTPAVTNGNASTGVSVNSNTTGIMVADSGNGQAHENRPPYIAAFYIQKLW